MNSNSNPLLINKLNKKLISLYEIFDITLDIPKIHGMHTLMTTSFTIRKRRKSSDSIISILIVYNLPSGCYIDPYELEKRHYWNILLQSKPFMTSIRVHTYYSSSDTEAIAENISNSIIGIELLLNNLNSSSIEYNNYVNYNMSFKLPIHLRYHLPSSTNKYANVSINYPDIYINDNIKSKHINNNYYYNNNIERIYDKNHKGEIGNAHTKDIDYNFKYLKCLDKVKYTSFKDTQRITSSCTGMVTLHMPIGSIHHTFIVDIITFLTVSLSTIAILYVLHRRGNLKDKGSP